MKNRIDFIIAGAQKSGTTALRTFLRQHPQIHTPGHEAHYFDLKINDHDYKYYHTKIFKLHKPQNKNKIAGECTPIYMYWPNSMERIQKYNPNIKIIFILRNPIERAYSHYQMAVKKEHETLSFWDALQEEQKRLKASEYFQRIYSYQDRGFYYAQICRILNLFPIHNILPLTQKELKNNHDMTLKKVYKFLGIDYHYIEPKEIMSNKYDNMTTECFDYLQKLFWDDNEKTNKLLFELLGCQTS